MDMESCQSFDKTDYSNDYFRNFEDHGEDHLLLDMDSYASSHGNPNLPMKSAFGDNESQQELTDWLTTPVEHWTERMTKTWLSLAASYFNVQPSFEAEIQKKFTFAGKDLLAMRREHFLAIDSRYGEMIHNMLHNQFGDATANVVNVAGAHIYNQHSYPEHQQLLPIARPQEINNNNNSNNNFNKLDDDKEALIVQASDVESDNSLEASEHRKRPPGRPKILKSGIKKKQTKSQGKLWEFIRDLLRNKKTCPSLICWEDYSEAKFRFVRSDEVAKLWGSRKGNHKMTYEKLSRAMRYYYKREIFLPVLGRRLVYKFGPKATGWQVDNPNFRRSLGMSEQDE
ncbi:ETS homologous factor-like [Trichogramma pretiosum]|uniref:ETS homologous factor-like n=1 Tax=Trichogramma pretiosum TaxID=7493 RepID=UPI0006C9408E|nr:ETS homologous factor-like [Trichogramma pretiosum]